MDPRTLSSALRRIASAIDNSENPSRELVAQDISKLITRLSASYWKFDAFLVPQEYEHLYNNLGYVDSINRREDLTEDELNQIMGLEDFVKKATRYFNNSKNEWFDYNGSSYTRKMFWDYINSVTQPIWLSVKKRFKLNH
jgi:hypothetical protein